MKILVLLAIKVYQRGVAPYLFTVCRFEPTCSRYSYDAVNRHGLWKGLAFTIKRLIRCHPWGRRGYDPVPR
ncbi:membrane protein insertion efficiency factor YidD [SAR202 cluster bacterium AD-804-J14_MRT_500m]|nr:membrane protein insertion efficiency factor YidD [SAR202 cluster bacterium AD-804-J14_MRT_500m]